MNWNEVWDLLFFCFLFVFHMFHFAQITIRFYCLRTSFEGLARWKCRSHEVTQSHTKISDFIKRFLCQLCVYRRMMVRTAMWRYPLHSIWVPTRVRKKSSRSGVVESWSDVRFESCKLDQSKVQFVLVSNWFEYQIVSVIVTTLVPVQTAFGKDWIC